MLSRALIVLLIVLNLGVATWWLWRQASTPAPQDGRIDGAPLLLLPSEYYARVSESERPAVNAETPGDAGQGADVAPVDNPVEVEPATTAVEPVAAPAAQPPPSQPSQAVVDAEAQCFVFGPGATPGMRERAAAFAVGPVRYRPLPDPAPAARGWRVVMPAQADLEQARAMQQRLREAGFTDQVLVRTPAEANSIALGLFGTRQAAERHQQALVAAGFQAQIHPANNDIRPALALQLRAGVDVDSVRHRLQVLRAQPLDCAELH